MTTTYDDDEDRCRYCGSRTHLHPPWCPFHDVEPDWLDDYVDPYDLDQAEDRYDNQVYGEPS